jgi:hypothetical protein
MPVIDHFTVPHGRDELIPWVDSTILVCRRRPEALASDIDLSNLDPEAFRPSPAKRSPSVTARPSSPNPKPPDPQRKAITLWAGTGRRSRRSLIPLRRLSGPTHSGASIGADRSRLGAGRSANSLPQSGRVKVGLRFSALALGARGRPPRPRSGLTNRLEGGSHVSRCIRCTGPVHGSRGWGQAGTKSEQAVRS